MRGWRLVLWSLLGAAVFVALFVVVTRSGLGQRLDDIAMEGRKATRLAPRRLATAVLQYGTPTALLVGGAAMVVAARRWRGALSATMVAGTLAATLIAARLLKAGLERQDLLGDSWVGPANTYPSGHTAVATVLVLLAVTVSPVRWRPWVSALGAAALVAHTTAMMGSGWHRPSDVVGGISLAVALCGPASLVISAQWIGERSGRESGAWFAGRRGVAVGAATAVAVVLCWYVPLRLLSTGANGESGFRSHLLVALASCVVAVVVVAVQAMLVDQVDAGGRTPAVDVAVPGASVLGEE